MERCRKPRKVVACLATFAVVGGLWPWAVTLAADVCGHGHGWMVRYMDGTSHGKMKVNHHVDILILHQKFIKSSFNWSIFSLHPTKNSQCLFIPPSRSIFCFLPRIMLPKGSNTKLLSKPNLFPSKVGLFVYPSLFWEILA